jgi:hypothetical protein
LLGKTTGAVDKLEFPTRAKNKEELNMALKMHAAVVEQFGKPFITSGIGRSLARSGANSGQD